MIDYGVRIGSEMSGFHFGVVLNVNDTKYARTVIVVPLSSHQQKNYVDLGFKMLESAVKLMDVKSKYLLGKIDELTERLDTFQSKQEIAGLRFEFDDNTVDYLLSNSIDLQEKPGSKLSIDLEVKDENIIELISSIKQLDAWKEYPDLLNFITRIDTILEFKNNLLQKKKSIEDEVAELFKLKDEALKYNTRSYAATPSIGLISKLRIRKLSNYTLSGNVNIPSDSLKLIFNKLSTIFDIANI